MTRLYELAAQSPGSVWVLTFMAAVGLGAIMWATGAFSASFWKRGKDE